MTYNAQDEQHRHRNREYQRQWYAKNREVQRKRVAVNKLAGRDRNREIVRERLNQGCVDCPEVDLIVLEFDHVRGDAKVADISKLLNHPASVERLTVELDKCDVVCANCHRRRTARRHGAWWKSTPTAPIVVHAPFV